MKRYIPALVLGLFLYFVPSSVLGGPPPVDTDLSYQSATGEEQQTALGSATPVALGEPMGEGTDNEQKMAEQAVSYTIKSLDIDTFILELHWGKKPTSGYSIEIVNTQYQGDILYVSYVTTEPKPGYAYSMVITYPSDSVIIKGKLPQQVILYHLT